jgi:hypothetical protein
MKHPIQSELISLKNFPLPAHLTSSSPTLDFNHASKRRRDTTRFPPSHVASGNSPAGINLSAVCGAMPVCRQASARDLKLDADTDEIVLRLDLVKQRFSIFAARFILKYAT